MAGDFSTLYWEITSDCNLRCKHCSQPHHNKNYYELGEAKKIVDIIVEYGTERIMFLGGEPILYPWIFEIIEYAKKKNLVTCMSSNGTLLGSEEIKALKEVGLDHLQISIDGLEKTHDKIRGRGTFAKAQKALSLAKNAGIHTYAKFTLLEDNADETIDVVLDCYKKGISCDVGLGIPVGSFSSKPISPEKYFTIFTYLFQLKKKLNLKNFLPDFSLEEFLEKGYASSLCPAGRGIFALTIDRKLSPCPFYSPIENFLPAFEPKLEKVLESRIFKLFRENNTFICLTRYFAQGKDHYSVYEFVRWKNNNSV